MGKEKFSDSSSNPGKQFYSTQEAADLVGISQPTLMLWIRNRLIDDATIKRDASGRRQWSEDNIRELLRVKKEEGWK